MADRRAPSEKPKGSGNPNRINRLLKSQAEKSYAGLSNLIMVSNKGLNSEATCELRSGLRAKGVRMHVVRNRLTMRAFWDMGLKEAEKLFSGPTAIIEAEDPVVAAKLAVEFCKKFEGKVVVIGGLVEGKILSAKEVLELAKSKSKPELLSEIVQLIGSPGARLAGALKGSGGRLAGGIKALVEKLEKSAAAEPPPAAEPSPAAAPEAPKA